MWLCAIGLVLAGAILTASNSPAQTPFDPLEFEARRQAAVVKASDGIILLRSYSVLTRGPAIRIPLGEDESEKCSDELRRPVTIIPEVRESWPARKDSLRCERSTVTRLKPLIDLQGGGPPRIYQRAGYASVFHEAEFRSLPKHLHTGSELRNPLEAAIEKIPLGRPLLVKGGSARAR